MNEEEKFLIHTLEGSINTYIEGTKVIRVQLTTKQAEILLNLISKLQKELEQEKEKNKKLQKELDIKDKVIDKMAEDRAEIGEPKVYKKTIINYYLKKVEEEND